VVDAILVDDSLTERQKQVLLEIHDSFRRENAAAAPVIASAPEPTTRKPTTRKAKRTPTDFQEEDTA
jgi:hypothetical protein